KAKKIFICNLMRKAEHTHDFTVADYTREIEKYLESEVDIVIYNNALPARTSLKRYASEGETPTRWNVLPQGRQLIGANLLSHRQSPRQKGDIWNRSLVRHEPSRLASLIVKILGVKNK